MKTALESLNKSSKIISYNSDLVMHTIENSLQDPTTNVVAIIWQPKAQAIHNYTSIVTNQIDTLIKRLNKKIKESGEDNNKIVNQLFIEEGNGIVLYNQIHSYISQVMKTDSRIQKQFDDQLDLLPNGFDTINSDGKKFNDSFFAHSNPTQALVMLAGLENRIKIAEDKLLTFCLSVIPRIVNDGSENFYSVIVGQNKSYLKAKEKLDITAGVGSFSRRCNPKILIGGQIINLDENGVANFSTKVSSIIGHQSIPVHIEYTDQDGKIVIIEKLVRYSVIKN
jgi:hypothetical protein